MVPFLRPNIIILSLRRLSKKFEAKKNPSEVFDARPRQEKINVQHQAEMTRVFVPDLFSFLLRLSSFGSSHVFCLLN